MPNSARTQFVASLLERRLPFVLLSVLALHYLWFVYSSAPNIPYHDDIIDFLRFVNRVADADSFWTALQEGFRQYNEHRTSASRLQVYIAYLIEGDVNFRTLAVLGNIALLLILFLFYIAARNDRRCWLYVLVAALLLLNLRAYRIVLWGQPALAYFYVYFYAFACIFALHRVTPARFLLAALLCSLSSMTLASGQIVWLFGLASLLHQSLWNRRCSVIYPALWLLLSIVMLLVWRIGFIAETPELSAEALAQLAKSHPRVLLDPTVSELLIRYASFFMVILGGAITATDAHLAVCFGSIMLGLLCFVTFRYYREEDVRLILCCWFAVATLAAVAVGRSAMLPPESALLSNNRYGFFSVMVMCTLVMEMQLRLSVFKTSMAYLLLALAVSYSVWSYQRFVGPLEQFLSARYESYNESPYYVIGYPMSATASIVAKAVKAGRYIPPCRPYPSCEEQTLTTDSLRP
ncbi:hypothetical protein [Candidatus Marimicrobium litorale]|uniref:Glycosyltransferase RgtA/B/C/D-like domain-containing protein n=1 Tax=Candidatus Marimicrobium litorale TaxID=2518991 RepID=A0ABT3T685_9GAMM|nr:hypothetical protein [Candidatus Marimicrobium litorale]MCX2977798.1 hypothetical protein [Candidatus Marimicrobium litorale]